MLPTSVFRCAVSHLADAINHRLHHAPGFIAGHALDDPPLQALQLQDVEAEPAHVRQRIAEEMIRPKTKRGADPSTPPLTCSFFLLRGLDLNQRPLGYE